MIKIMVKKSDGTRVVWDTVTGAREDVPNNCDKALQRIKKKFLNNQQRRLRNEILRDMTGTSARAARKDMGL